jgi:hypothetical protein
MIDLNDIDSEIANLAASVGGFTSVETGRIREAVPAAQMPALDVSCSGHKSEQTANVEYKVPVMIVIRRRDFTRADNAQQFKEFIRQIIAVFEGYKGAAFDVIRNIQSEIPGVTAAGEGHVERSVYIALEVWAH